MFLTHPSLQILDQIQTAVFLISRFLVDPLSNKIVKTPEPVIILTQNLDQKLNLTSITERQKKMTMTSCKQIVVSLSFFRFMANLEQSKSRIQNAWSANLKFSLTVTLYFKKTENRTKKSQTQLSYFCFE